MVVCKFFQQGSCRYGQNCRFDHIYGSRYSYQAAAAQTHAPSSGNTVTDDQLVKQVHSDIQAALKGGQWLLSSYAPFKDHPECSFPGLINLCPEEARLLIYEAKANNKLDEAIAHMNNLFKEARSKYEQLLQRNTNMVNIFRSMYNGQQVPSPFTNNTNTVFGGSNTNASSLFRSAAQTPFGLQNTSPSVFGQKNAFGPQSNSNAAKSLFSQATQNAFGGSQSPSSVFAQANQMAGQQTASSLFNQANQSMAVGQPQPDQNMGAPSVFGQANQNIFTPAPAFEQAKSVFSAANNALTQNQSPFGVAQQSNNPPFGQTQTVFQSSQNVFEQAADDKIYSKMEDLSQDQIDAFTSNEFTLGFIPEVPPPLALCK